MRNKNNALEISVKTISEENVALISLSVCVFVLLEKSGSNTDLPNLKS